MSYKSWNRKGCHSGTGFIPGWRRTAFSAVDENKQPILLPDKNHGWTNITAITCGAGNRAMYMAAMHFGIPDQLDIVGVAEPIPIPQWTLCAKHNNKWKTVSKPGKMFQAKAGPMPSSSPRRIILHYGPCEDAGNGLWCIAGKTHFAQWKRMPWYMALAKKKPARIVAVCHVLRLCPVFCKAQRNRYKAVYWVIW